MVFLDGVGGVNPGGVDQVAKLDSARRQTFVGKSLSFGSPGPVEGPCFIELMSLFDERVGVEDVIEILIPFVVDDSWLGGGDKWGNIGVALHIGGDVDGLELRMDARSRFTALLSDCSK